MYKMIARAPIVTSSRNDAVRSIPICSSSVGVTTTYEVLSPYAFDETSHCLTKSDSSTKKPTIGINTINNVIPLRPISCNRRQE